MIKNIASKILSVLAFIHFATDAFSQIKLFKDTVAFPNTRIKSDIFILNSCDPTQISLRRKYDDDRFYINQSMGTRKLSTASNHLTAMKIEGINPLRYSYFINNELVTQFMETAPTSSTGIQAINKAFGVQEIKYLELFKIKFENSNQLEVMKRLSKEIEVINRALSPKVVELGDKLELIRHYDNDSNHRGISQKEYNDAQARQKIIDKDIKSLSDSLDSKVGEYMFYANGLPINNSRFSLLERWKIIGNNSSGDPAIEHILNMMETFAKHYEQMSNDFDTISVFLSNPDEYTGEIKKPYKGNYEVSSILKKLSLWGYHSYLDFIRDYIYYEEGNTATDTYFSIGALRVKEFMISKKLQAFEEIVLSLSGEVGKLLELEFLNNSQYLNSIYSQYCLDSAKINEVVSHRERLEKIFRMIHDISVDISVLTSFLNLDLVRYKDIVDAINKNYTKLIDHMKYLSHIGENTSVEFTLPTSTNLRNVDLIRYKIQRKDNSTGGEQTYTYDYWIKGGLKVDFSAGIFATGLTDHQYEKFQLTTDSVRIKRKDIGKKSFGFGGMVNVSPRLGASWITFGGSAGVIYSDNQKLQLIGGFSLHFGKTEKLILHIGGALGTVKILDQSNNSYAMIEEDEEYRVMASVNQFNIAMVDKFMFRPFFGISYNLSKKNALQAVSGPGYSKYNSLMEEPKTKTLGSQ